MVLAKEDLAQSNGKWHCLLHLLYVLIFMLCAIRVLQNFLLFDSLGPKLRMIKDMMQVKGEICIPPGWLTHPYTWPIYPSDWLSDTSD